MAAPSNLRSPNRFASSTCPSRRRRAWRRRRARSSASASAAPTSPAISARCRSSVIRASPATNWASRSSRSAMDVTQRQAGRSLRGRAVHQLPEVLFLHARPHQLLREPSNARRPLRRRLAAALHCPRPQAARLDQAEFRATGAGRNAGHRLSCDQPRQPASPMRRSSSSAPGRSA